MESAGSFPFTSASHWSVSWGSWTQYTHYNHIPVCLVHVVWSFRGSSLDTGNWTQKSQVFCELRVVYFAKHITACKYAQGNVPERWDRSSNPEPPLPKSLYQLSSLRSNFTMLQPTTLAHAVRFLIHFQKIPGLGLSRTVLLCHSGKVAGVVSGHDFVLPCPRIRYSLIPGRQLALAITVATDHNFLLPCPFRFIIH
jgi:hypothetical protein